MHVIRLASFSLFAVWFVLLAPAILPAAQTGKPNILLILSDDHGYADIGVHGCKDFTTPHLDSIARNGVRCTSGYVSAPQCAPSRCGLLTGRYQNRFGYEFNNDSPGVGLPLTEKTLADRLKAAGYTTGAVGKWHLGAEDAYHPLQRGFDEFFGFLGGGHSYLAPPGRAAQANRSRLLRNREPVPHTQYVTDMFGDEAVAFIERHASESWFLYLAFNAPHSPVEATPEYLARVPGIADEKRRTYAAMVTAMDDNIGRVLAKLRETNQEQNTLIVFLSDNGGPLGNAWNGSDNAPLSGQKGDTLEGGIRVPFLAQWKGVIPAGTVFDQPVISLDLAPTFLAVAGTPPPADTKLDGVNLLSAWKGEAPLPQRPLFWRFNFPPGREELYKTAIREGDWKHVKNWERSASDQPVPGTLKLIDLTKDITETQDQSTAQPGIAADLKAKWEAWNKQLAEPFDGKPRIKETRGGKAKAKADK